MYLVPEFLAGQVVQLYPVNLLRLVHLCHLYRLSMRKRMQNNNCCLRAKQNSPLSVKYIFVDAFITFSSFYNLSLSRWPLKNYLFQVDKDCVLFFIFPDSNCIFYLPGNPGGPIGPIKLGWFFSASAISGINKIMDEKQWFPIQLFFT